MRFCSLFFGFIFFISAPAMSQARVSIATDASLLRNMSPKQKFFAFGNTVIGNFHFKKRESAYVWFTYYSAGKFKNTFLATAKSPQTIPATMNYGVKGIWRFREVSMGWKHYFKGSFDEENTWSLYGISGFGLMFTQAENNFVSSVDTSLYQFQPSPVGGINYFKRLILDLGLGAEYPATTDFYVYGEIKTWIHTSDYPSKYLHENKNVPLPLMLNVGIRILFDLGY